MYIIVVTIFRVRLCTCRQKVEKTLPLIVSILYTPPEMKLVVLNRVCGLRRLEERRNNEGC